MHKWSLHGPVPNRPWTWGLGTPALNHNFPLFTWLGKCLTKITASREVWWTRDLEHFWLVNSILKNNNSTLQLIGQLQRKYWFNYVYTVCLSVFLKKYQRLCLLIASNLILYGPVFLNPSDFKRGGFQFPECPSKHGYWRILGAEVDIF